MPNEPDDVIANLRSIRDEHASSCGYDLDRLFAELLDEQASLKRDGWHLVRLAPPGSVEQDSAHPL